jgi:hypothetical protein
VRLTAADIKVRHDNARKMAERAAKKLRKFRADVEPEVGFTVRHGKRKGTINLQFPIEVAINLARRMGYGWYVTRNTPDKYGRCDVAMTWVPTWQPTGVDECSRPKSRNRQRRNKAHDF